MNEAEVFTCPMISDKAQRVSPISDTLRAITVPCVLCDSSESVVVITHMHNSTMLEHLRSVILDSICISQAASATQGPSNQFTSNNTNGCTADLK